ncbi:hypothetical protein AAFF_G00316100 [Aldrovandia affinis]|uniref:Uncharacterized protein n=1 Tax=Aldrovandia affinis TaxID=143900 RepID=A0AAD7WQT6_9TELE|nr:hypothetical protein AAFF_G00316100 [Aldrovandia affinis]
MSQLADHRTKVLPYGVDQSHREVKERREITALARATKRNDASQTGYQELPSLELPERTKPTGGICHSFQNLTLKA